MADQNYIGVNGIVTQSLQQIQDDLVAKFNNIYGADVNLEQNSPDAQFLMILAQEKKDILDLCVQFYNNLDTERVVGIPQQILYKLNGLEIKAFTYSYVYIDITTTKALNLQGIPEEEVNNADVTGYTVSDTNGNRWILTTGQAGVNTVSLTEGLNENLRFRAAELGSVEALANTITVMETIIAGVQSVNNPANNYQTGATGELDSAFRLRRNRSVTMPSQGFEDALEAQLLTIENVAEAKVYSNRTDATADGIPAHTVWVIVKGGADEKIGQAIYYNIPPGIPMKGTKSVPISRPNGTLETVNFDTASEIQLYVDMKIKPLSGAIDQNYIKQQLAELTFEIGQSAEAVNIASTVKDIISANGTPYDVGVSLTNDNYSEIVSPSDLDEYFSISTDNITIQVI
ncbi:MAG: hypothetical protein J6Q32_05910 [Clostridia bacterium]|nr:hypothetical protein [Clostridia bacterium]